MQEVFPEKNLRQIPQFYDTAHTVSRTIHQKVLDGGSPTRKIADFFHGVWLGHPVHAVLTDVVVGAWGLGTLFDLLGMGKKDSRNHKAADLLIELGTAAAVPTAIAGITDFSTAPRNSLATGGAHGLLNAGALVLYGLSIAQRRQGNRGIGVLLSTMTLGLIGASAWLGGELVYRFRVGVNKGEHPANPKDWTAVMDAADLLDRQPRKVEVNGRPVLLYRLDGAIYAIDDTCSHEGGPLSEGEFDGDCVTCPWHQSVFDLKDGSVVHGPSVYPQAPYETRVQDGMVELRVIPPVS